VLKVEAGESPETVIATLGFDRTCIYRWLARYREGGLGGLSAKPIPGRPAKLSGSQLRQVYGWITEKTPRQLRFEFALWTRAMIRELIREHFGVHLSEVSVGRLLRTLAHHDARATLSGNSAARRDAPELGGMRPERILRSAVLPAPFAPIRPVKDPGSSSKVTPFIASWL